MKRFLNYLRSLLFRLETRLCIWWANRYYNNKSNNNKNNSNGE